MQFKPIRLHGADSSRVSSHQKLHFAWNFLVSFRLPTGKGYIPTSSLKDILKELDETLTPEDLDNIIGEIDTDGSGTVDFDGKPRLRFRPTRTLSHASSSITGVWSQPSGIAIIWPHYALLIN